MLIDGLHQTLETTHRQRLPNVLSFSVTSTRSPTALVPLGRRSLLQNIRASIQRHWEGYDVLREMSG